MLACVACLDLCDAHVVSPRMHTALHDVPSTSSMAGPVSSRAVWACVLVVLCALAGFSDALFFHVTEGSQRCYIEEVRRRARCEAFVRQSAAYIARSAPFHAVLLCPGCVYQYSMLLWRRNRACACPGDGCGRLTWRVCACRSRKARWCWQTSRRRTSCHRRCRTRRQRYARTLARVIRGCWCRVHRL